MRVGEHVSGDFDLLALKSFPRTLAPVLLPPASLVLALTDAKSHIQSLWDRLKYVVIQQHHLDAWESWLQRETARMAAICPMCQRLRQQERDGMSRSGVRAQKAVNDARIELSAHVSNVHASSTGTFFVLSKMPQRYMLPYNWLRLPVDERVRAERTYQAIHIATCARSRPSTI